MGFISIIKYMPAKKAYISVIFLHKYKLNKNYIFNLWHHENQDLL
jgi:hypothetical protein